MDSTTENKANYGRDLLASVVVFLVALPLCMGIALASGVPVAAGLMTGIIGGIIVGTFAGSPLQVSGPAAGLAVIIFEFVQDNRLEHLGLAVLLAGVIQMAAGLARIGQWFRAVSPAVIEGMLAGIGVLILSSQFHVMVDDDPKGSGLVNLITIPQAVMKGLPITPLEELETRKFLASNLRGVGTLHEEQVQIDERLAEHRRTVGMEENFDLAPIIERQVAVVDQFRTIQGKMDEAGVFGGKKGPKRQDAFNNAANTLDQAMTILQEDELDAAAVINSQDDAVEALFAAEQSLKNHGWAAKIGLLTIVVIVCWRLAPKVVRAVPAPLVAIIIATAVAAGASLPVLYVEVPDNLLSEIHIPTMAVVETADWNTVIVAAIVIAIVASAETLLCATAVDQLHSGARTKYNRELFAQGVGNTLCGAVGGLPMTGVIVRSAANVQAGATSRLSAVVHGFWLLAFVAIFPFVLRLIPTSALAAMLVYIGYRLMNFGKLKALFKVSRSDGIIFLVTVGTIVATDLLTGVITGFGLSAIILLKRFSKLNVELNVDDATGQSELVLDGAATFLGIPKLAERLENVQPGTTLKINTDRLTYMDHASHEIVIQWEAQHRATGGEVIIDWDELEKSRRV